MKVAIYSIALNEEQFVERWFKSGEGADYFLIADTGSTDKTVEIAERLGIKVIKVSINPWRFDDARNASLAAIPADIDYCIALDLDEILQPGWKSELEQAHKLGITRPTYRFITSWLPDGSPGTEFDGFRVHARHGYRWVHPIHEIPNPYGITETRMRMQFEIHHRPDDNKSRGQYLPLLKMAVDEDPTSDRYAFYYARELYFRGLWEESIKEFKRYLDLPKAVWEPERASAMNYLARMDSENTREWCERSIAQSSGRREPMVIMSRHFYNIKDWEHCLSWAENALLIKEKKLDYIVEDFAWGFEVYDLAAISAWNLDLKELALEYGEKAVELNPTDERLQRNLVFYRGTGTI
jgi:glycosyltransferase involved in cell wall biosynthesis